MTRNQSLEHIEGPRTYIPAPNHVIVRVRTDEKTKGGILLPFGGGEKVSEDSEARMHPIGEVLAVGQAQARFGDVLEPPCQEGDTVMFTISTIPPHWIEGDLHTFDWGMIYLIVRAGKHVGGVFHEPMGEESANGGEEVLEGV